MNPAPTQSPYVFLLDSAVDGVPDHALDYFTGALLSATSKADLQGTIIAEIRGGLPMISHFAEKMTAVHREGRGSGHTISYDMEVYKTLIWDMSDATASGWRSIDPEAMMDVLRRRDCEVLALSDLPDAARDAVDAALRNVPGYVGAFALDPGNPIQRYAFYDHLLELGWIQNGAVLQETTFEGDQFDALDGADDFKPGGLVWKPHFWRFETEAPKLAKVDTSARGQISLDRLDAKTSKSVEERVFRGLAGARWSDNSGREYAFDAVEQDRDILEAVMPEGKFTKYLFDLNHKDGGGKAKFFIETLGFDPQDWRFLAAQFYEGLLLSEPRDLEVKHWQQDFGAKFNAYVRVRSRTGADAIVRAGWMLRPGQLPQLVTAFPDQDQIAIVEPNAPPIVAPSASAEAFHAELFELADKAGLDAHEATVPTPLFLKDYEVVEEGEAGSASVVIKDARSGFAQWALQNNKGHVVENDGVHILVPSLSQSIDRKEAFARAFARVLALNGVAASIWSRGD